MTLLTQANLTLIMGPNFCGRSIQIPRRDAAYRQAGPPTPNLGWQIASRPRSTNAKYILISLFPDQPK